MARSLQEVIMHGFANTLKPLKQLLSLRKELKTTKLSKPKPCNNVLSCLAMFYSKVFARNEFHVCITLSFLTFRAPFVVLDRALYAIAFSVLDIGVIYLWPWV